MRRFSTSAQANVQRLYTEPSQYPSIIGNRCKHDTDRWLGILKHVYLRRAVYWQELNKN